MRRRMAEIGVRKAFGATANELMRQVFLENLLLTCLAGSYLVTGDWLFTVLIEGGMFAVVGLLFHKRSAVIGHAHEVKDRHTR